MPRYFGNQQNVRCFILFIAYSVMLSYYINWADHWCYVYMPIIDSFERNNGFSTGQTIWLPYCWSSNTNMTNGYHIYIYCILIAAFLIVSIKKKKTKIFNGEIFHYQLFYIMRGLTSICSGKERQPIYSIDVKIAIFLQDETVRFKRIKIS